MCLSCSEIKGERQRVSLVYVMPEHELNSEIAVIGFMLLLDHYLENIPPHIWE